ncbi:MAG: hypothetical protein GY787_21420 [Alteromonadales bacterium]|nr:hypothetical protein [Alteromonadales bacterium]
MTTFNSFSALKTVLSTVSTNNNNEESTMTYNELNNYGVSEAIVNVLMEGNKQVEMDMEVIAYDQWFLNRPVVRTVNGEVLNTQVIKEAKSLIGKAKVEIKVMTDAKIKQQKKEENMAKEARKAAKRVLRKEQKMETAKMVKVEGMTDMEFVNNETIICHEETVTVTVKQGYASVSINEDVIKEEEVMEVMEVKTKEVITKGKGGFMNNDPEGFGPQRWCNCHNGVTDETIEEQELLITTLTEEVEELDYQVEEAQSDIIVAMEEGEDESYIDSITGDITAIMDEANDKQDELANAKQVLSEMIHETTGSRTKLETCEDGFFCPACEQVYATDGLVFDGHADSMAYVLDSEMPNYKAFADVEIKSCRSVSLIGKEETVRDMLVKELSKDGSGLLDDAGFDMFHKLTAFICDEEYLNSEMKDGLGRGMVSYEEFMENNDDAEDNGINVQTASEKLIPWLGETVNILGMLDFKNKAGDFMFDGAFKRYYKTNHFALATHIKTKATEAKKNIYALANTEVDGETVIDAVQESYLINVLWDEYEYWMAFLGDGEWNGYKKHQFMRSECLDHVAKGGSLKYYQYETKAGEISFGYHKDTYTKENVAYVDGSIDLTAEVDRKNELSTLADILGKNENNWWSAYKHNNNWFVNAAITTESGDYVQTAFSGFANQEVVDFFRAMKEDHLKDNTWEVINNLKESGVKVNSNLYYFTKQLLEFYNVEVAATVNKQISSNKWLADLQFMGKDVVVNNK